MPYNFSKLKEELKERRKGCVFVNFPEGTYVLTGKEAKDYISEFISDGIIHITFESMGGEFSRSLLIRKMRRVKNDEDIHPLEISSKGIIIHNIK